MAKMTERFQRAALIAEAARLEHYILDQQALTLRQYREAQDRGVSQVVEHLDQRRQQLEKCRALANQLRSHVWELE